MMRKWMLVVIGALLSGMLSQQARAQVVCTDGVLIAKSQFRRTVDPSPRGPVGTLELKQDGNAQSVRIDIKRLNETDLSVFISTNSFYNYTNSPVYFVSLLNRTGEKKGNWSDKLTGKNGAPPELQVIVPLDITCLTDIQKIRSFDVGVPGQTNILGGVTNLSNCVDIFTNGQIITVCDSNIVGGVTNIFVDTFLWAPVPQLLAKPSKSSFKSKIILERPDVLPPSPKATGTVKFRYGGADGQSRMEVTAKKLVKGQTYTLWIPDAGTNYSCGNLELDKSGATGRYLRDTKFGDPLPFQAPSVADLTGRVYQITDPFGNIDLEGGGGL